MDWLRHMPRMRAEWELMDGTHIGADIFPPDPGSASAVTSPPPAPVPTTPAPRLPFLTRIAIGAVPALVGWLAWGTPGAIVGGIAGAAIADEIDHG